MAELPPINRQLLARLAAHLSRVVRRTSSNKMSWPALAIALAPTLLRRGEQPVSLSQGAPSAEQLARIKARGHSVSTTVID